MQTLFVVGMVIIGLLLSIWHIFVCWKIEKNREGE